MFYLKNRKISILLTSYREREEEQEVQQQKKYFFVMELILVSPGTHVMNIPKDNI